MQVVLVMFKGDGMRRSFALHKPVTLIGRREDCDVRIPLGEISRKHCKLTRESESVLVEDLGSSNGTFVNGKRVQSASLAPGDTLQIGSVVFVIQLDGVPADEELSPRTSGKSSGVKTGRVGASGGLEPTDVSDITDGTPGSSASDGAEQPFDPATILEGPNDSGGLNALDSSSLADDIAADLERANRSR